MTLRDTFSDFFAGSLHVCRWLLLGSLVGGLAGTASAAFLVSLDYVTALREKHAWIILFLPVGGFAVGWLYHYIGASAARGNDLLLDEIHAPKTGVPKRLAPLILLATLLTHVVGGSAGREGTAVQMGGGLAAMLGRILRVDAAQLRLLLIAGISAGFGSVFGTPLAGFVFGLEVLSVGRIRYDALMPCLVASVTGDLVCREWGATHHEARIDFVPELVSPVVAKVVIAGMLFGLCAGLFAWLTHAVAIVYKRFIAYPPLRPFVGGFALLALVWLVGSTDYLGLSLPVIRRSFDQEGVAMSAFAWKLLFTALTLGSGFKGGEVTPLFCIGAALGCTLGTLMGVPADFMAGLGFAAVFAGAANTPLSCTLLGIELFGREQAVWFALACGVAYLTAGGRGIYSSQRLEERKSGGPLLGDLSGSAPPP